MSHHATSMVLWLRIIPEARKYLESFKYLLEEFLLTAQNIMFNEKKRIFFSANKCIVFH